METAASSVTEWLRWKFGTEERRTVQHAAKTTNEPPFISRVRASVLLCLSSLHLHRTTQHGWFTANEWWFRAAGV